MKKSLWISLAAAGLAMGTYSTQASAHGGEPLAGAIVGGVIGGAVGGLRARPWARSSDRDRRSASYQPLRLLRSPVCYRAPYAPRTTRPGTTGAGAAYYAPPPRATTADLSTGVRTRSGLPAPTSNPPGLPAALPAPPQGYQALPATAQGYQQPYQQPPQDYRASRVSEPARTYPMRRATTRRARIRGTTTGEIGPAHAGARVTSSPASAGLFFSVSPRACSRR